MSNFRLIDRETSFLLPPSVDDWLPQQRLARFVVEVIDGLDTSAMSGAYRGSGSASSARENRSACQRKSVTTGSWLSIGQNSPRVRRNIRRQAESQAADRPRRRRKARCQLIKST